MMLMVSYYIIRRCNVFMCQEILDHVWLNILGDKDSSSTISKSSTDVSSGVVKGSTNLTGAMRKLSGFVSNRKVCIVCWPLTCSRINIHSYLLHTYMVNDYALYRLKNWPQASQDWYLH